MAEAEIDIFSDLIWEGVLNKVEYLENISAQHMHLFRCDEKEMHLISVKVLNPDIDLNTKEGFGWFKKNWQSDFIEYLTAAKAYSEEKNMDKFELIRKRCRDNQGRFIPVVRSNHRRNDLAIGRVMVQKTIFVALFSFMAQKPSIPKGTRDFFTG